MNTCELCVWYKMTTILGWNVQTCNILCGSVSEGFHHDNINITNICFLFTKIGHGFFVLWKKENDVAL